MSSQRQTIYFISGANRGIGLGFVQALAKRPDTVIYAAVRDPSNANELQKLNSLTKNIHIIKLESVSESDAKAAAEKIENISGYVDVVIANAGILKYQGPVVTTPIQEIRDHYEVNFVGPLILFQALYPLLKKSKSGAPKFVVISTVLGSIGDMYPVPTTPYGASKAAINYVTKKIHQEHENDGLIAFPMHPGLVQTDLGNPFAKCIGMEQAPVTIEDSIQGQLKVIDGATREKTSGKFWDFEGNELAW
jgi:norsolorinic acid ketoreductase